MYECSYTCLQTKFKEKFVHSLKKNRKKKPG